MALIKNNIEQIKESDAWSFILFALFKMRDIPEFSSLSELVYVLDKSALLKLCEFFGGQTITIPTIAELETMVYGLLLYNLIDLQMCSYEEAVKSLPKNAVDAKDLRNAYIKIRDMLDTYEFTFRGI